jgi:hypothetical protein
MIIAEKVKVCIYASTLTYKDRVFKSWASAWLRGADRSEEGAWAIATRSNRTIGSFCGKAANFLAASYRDETNREVLERSANKMADEVFSLIFEVLPEFDLELTRAQAAVYDDFVEAQDFIGHRSYVDKGRKALSVEEFNGMVAEQDEKCAICRKHRVECELAPAKDGKRKFGFVIDHCHETGKIRGLLCNRCNLGIGLFTHSPLLMELAAKYLREHEIIPLTANR